jgi:hypothetical protein
MQLGETIATYDLGLALRAESGKFEVTSPTGEIYHVVCQPNHSISNFEWAGSRTNPQPFLARKITETVSREAGKETNETQTTGTQAQSNGTPFLLESQADDGEPLFAEGSVAPKIAEDSQRRKVVKLELAYLESDPETVQPATWVFVKSAVSGGGSEPEMFITARCATFNELDAEIRKLHAQLDEIRSHARKKFYTAHSAATA